MVMATALRWVVMLPASAAAAEEVLLAPRDGVSIYRCRIVIEGAAGAARPSQPSFASTPLPAVASPRQAVPPFPVSPAQRVKRASRRLTLGSTGPPFLATRR